MFQQEQAHTCPYELVREEMEADAVIKSATILSVKRHTFKGKETWNNKMLYSYFVENVILL